MLTGKDGKPELYSSDQHNMKHRFGVPHRKQGEQELYRNCSLDERLPNESVLPVASHRKKHGWRIRDVRHHLASAEIREISSACIQKCAHDHNSTPACGFYLKFGRGVAVEQCSLICAATCACSSGAA